MKKILGSFVILCSLLIFSGCEGITTEDHSILTYYVDIEMQGDAVMLVTVGTPYVDPGYTATEKGVDVYDKVVVSGDEVDPNTIGLYTVNYAAVNVDGFTTSVDRTVIVCNPAVTTDISGRYQSATGTYRNYNNGTIKAYSGYDVDLVKIAPGFFSVSDFWGGYYYPRLKASNYTIAYTCSGYIQLNPDNTIGLLTNYVPGWGDSLDGMTNGRYDPVTGSLYWEVGYAGIMTFYVTLTK
jgi:hypothetical protein